MSGPGKSKALTYVLIALIVTVPLATLGLMFRANVETVFQYFTGRHGICTLPESFRSADDSQRQITRADYLILNSALSSHADDGTELWKTPDGDWWVPSRSGNAILYDLSEQDRDIYRTGGGVKSGDVVLDCGANVGVFARKALARGAARVIAIEPAPENLICLRKNLAGEIAAGKVTVYEKGVWDRDDKLTMHINPKNSAADSFVRTRPESSDIVLPVTTVDGLVAELNLGRVDFIKMDIEGAERRAISGAAVTIRRFRPRMALCVYHLPDDPVVIPRAVLSLENSYRTACGCLRGPDSIFAEVVHFRLE